MEQLTTEREDLIIEAAGKRFAYYGFSKVTMEEIAADIGLGKASLYYYFPTKEHLFEAVVRREVGQFFADIEESLKKNIPASDMLRHYAGKRIEHFRTLANLRILGFQQPHEMRTSILDLHREFKEREIIILQKILLRGRDAGEFEAADPQQTAEAVMQMLYGPRAWLAKKIDKELDEETYSRLKESTGIIVEIILNGIKSRT